MESTQGIGKKITSGLVWTYLERILAQGVSTLVTIVLARLLTPEHYGVVSIVTIFITICDTLVVGGFSDTLIQKTDADDLDFSTLFWFVLVIGFIMFGVVFAAAPLVETFFNTSMVAVTLRVMAIRLPINAINSIQSAYISKTMKYRYFFFATLAGTLVSAVVGIIMAYCGFGVWALVAQYLSNSIIDTFVLWVSCGWKASLRFDFGRLRKLYSFGWKMQLSTILSALYSEVESFCIGKKYTSVDLAYYEKGRQFPRLIMHNVQSSITKVMLPAFSKVKESQEMMKIMARRSIQISTYVMCPLLIGLMACSTEFVTAVLTEKWLPAVPFLRILSVYYLCEPLMALNKQIVIACGQAQKYLEMEIQKKIIGVIILLISLVAFDSVTAIAVAAVLTQLVGLIIQSIPLRELIQYPIEEQVRDASTSFLLSIIMIIPVIILKSFQMNIWVKLASQIFIGMFVYLGLSIVLKNKAFFFLLKMLKQIVNKKHMGVKIDESK